MSASSTPARFASIFARMLLIRLLWWIFESTHWGLLRRTAAVINRMPAWSYTSDFHSASTISVQPDWFQCGLMPDVTFSPRVSVNRTWASSDIPLARSVSNTALRTADLGGTPAKHIAWADAIRRSRCGPKSAMRPRYTRSPSHTASPP